MKITNPTLLLDAEKCKTNIRKITLKAKKNNLIFRPHFKTHQSIEIGEWFRNEGINAITVSSVKMANYFSTHWDDILIAFPVNILEIDEINLLASKINLTLLIENLDSLVFLSENLKFNVNYNLKIDIGYNRTGIEPDNFILINELIHFNSEHLNFTGFLGHAGHSYKCRSNKDITEVHVKSTEIIKSLKSIYKQEFPDLKVSIGDTPTCSIVSEFEGIDELRPGNLVFYDLTQNNISSNTIDEIAVCMVCPVVAIHPDRNEVVIYGGGVHFAKDFLVHKDYGTIYGIVVDQSNWGKEIPNCYIKSLSQEHGILHVSYEFLSKLKVGDLIHILPVHSCMTANSMGEYYTTEGERISRLN